MGDPERALAVHVEHGAAVVGTGAHRRRRRGGVREDLVEGRRAQLGGRTGIAQDAATRAPPGRPGARAPGPPGWPRPDAAVRDPDVATRVDTARDGDRREVVAAPPSPALVGA